MTIFSAAQPFEHGDNDAKRAEIGQQNEERTENIHHEHHGMNFRVSPPAPREAASGRSGRALQVRDGVECFACTEPAPFSFRVADGRATARAAGRA